MLLKKAPEPFSPAFGEILYAVSLSEEEKNEEVSIFNSTVTEKIGIKKATTVPEFILNVSDYVRSQIAIHPFPIRESGIIDASERTFYSCIAHQEWASVNPHTAGIVPVGVNEPMCSPIARYLAENEQDEICWIAGTGTASAYARFENSEKITLEIPLGETEVNKPRMLTLIVNGRHLCQQLQLQGKKWAGFSRFTIEIRSNGLEMAVFNYQIRPHNCSKTRLAWWNRQGAIDFYSFETTGQENHIFEKKQISSTSRNLNLSAQCRKEKIIYTAGSTRKQGDWLSQILGSPQVWVVENNGFSPVEILNKEPFPVNDPAKTEIALKLAYSDTIPYQSF